MEVSLNTADDISQLETSVAAAGYERAVVSSDEDSDEDNEDSKDRRHRVRFHSERPEAQRTSSSSQPKTDIPDTLGILSEFFLSFATTLSDVGVKGCDDLCKC